MPLQVMNLAHVTHRAERVVQTHPAHLQMDTNDYCNLNCIYCCAHNPSPDKTTVMSLEMVNKIISQVADWKLESIRPFSRGDPLFEKRMPEIVKIIRKHTNTPIMLSTNGTVFDNKELLVNPDINEVNFTVSATTPESYERICGKPLFKEALRTLEWFRVNKIPSQKMTVSFIPNKLNETELYLWSRAFKNYGPVVSTMHRLYRNEHLLKNILASKEITKMATYGRIPRKPCTLWGNMGINAQGDILQCCGGDDVITYGNVNDTPLSEGWSKRCKNYLNNALCQSCNYRHSSMIGNQVSGS